ncbi:hypothetical protein ACLB2K_045902 [Fragaria x ananassa]
MREKNDFTVLEPPESNHEVNDPLPAENSKCFHVISAENRAMDEQMVSERVRQKLQDVNTAVQNYLSPVQDHVNFTLQQAYFKCAYECFDRRRSQQEIGNCVENCSVPVVSAQQRVENEMAKFQERLSRALMVCQDKFDAAKLQQAKTSALNDLESCVQQTTEDGIKMLPLLAERLKSSFSINN